jgi:glycosyltransferase involved in cell wall biosynthesis
VQIAFVTETYPPEIGGAAMAAGRFVEALLARGHHVRLVRPRQANDPLPSFPGLETSLVRGTAVPFHAGLQLGLPAGAALERRWRAEPPDLVHLVSEGLLGRSALRAALRLGLPVTTSFHTNFHRYARHYGFAWLAPLALRYLRGFHSHARLTLVPTRQVQQQLDGQGFRNLAVVSRGVDAALFAPARRREDLRRRWGAAPDDLVALTVGRLAPEKNLELAVEAFLALRGVQPRARLVLVGEGPLRASLAAAHPEIVFTGMLRGEELAAHYASADVFLFPSLTETFGNVCLEAMASGLAVLAFDDGAAREHVRHGANGLVADPARPQDFVGQAALLAAEPARARILGAAARSTAEGLGWAAVGDRLEALMLEVAREAAASRLASTPSRAPARPRGATSASPPRAEARG